VTVYLIATIENYVCLDADVRPVTTDIPIGSRMLVADTGAEEMYVGDYYASGVLSVDDQPEAADTILVGATTYTFLASGANEAGEVNVGASIAAAIVNIVAAINGTDGYNTANASVTAEATAADEITVTSIVTGTAANAVATVYTPTAAVTNAFAAATLTGGHDEWTELP
jgi:hypothetical protein